MAALGATLGTALDGIHSHFGATRYARPVFWLAAWWVPPLFAGAFSIGLLRPLLRREPPPPWWHAAASMALFVVAYFASVLPWSWPAVSAVLLALFALSYGAFDRTVPGLLVCVGGAFGGPLVEWTLVSLGLFEHTHPAFLGVSGWLPCLYLVAGVGLQTLARRLVDGP